jgi:hypothetical protein
MSLATVLFTDPIKKVISIFADDFNRIIRTTAIDYDVFKVWVALIENRPDSFLQKPALIERRRYD